MKAPEHVAFSFLIAQLGIQQHYGWAGTALVVLAGNLPDVDVLTLVGGWEFYRKHHRRLGHGVIMTLLGPLSLALLGSAFGLGPLLPLWAWLQCALVAHLACDILFYRWPVQLLWPFSSRGWGVGLVGWNDLVPTLALYGATAVSLALTLKAGAGNAAAWVAGTGIAAVVLYLAWRALRPRPRQGLGGWLAGNWTGQVGPFWRWLTGDFIT
jgi:hypothetical protein